MRPALATGTAGALAVGLALALLAPGLGRAPFDDPGEGQHAEIAREVLASGDLVTLRLAGVRYLDKPPLLYWLTAGAFGLFGPAEWAARLVPLGGTALAVAGAAVLGARLLGPWGGFLAGAALLGSPLFAAFGRYLRPESLFVAAIGWGLAGLLLAAREGRRRWAWAGCAALGLACLAKDPLGALGPLGAVAAAHALTGGARPWRRWLPPAALALLAVVGLGWYAVAAVRSPGFLWYTVVDNHLLNVARLRHFPDEDVPLGALEFLAVSSLGAFPWILPAAIAAWDLCRRRAWREPAEAPWLALALWAAGVLALFTLAPFKLPHYGLPAYPALALLGARAWQARQARPGPLIALHLAGFALLAVVATAALLLRPAGLLEAVLSATDVTARKAVAPGGPGWGALEPLLARSALLLALGAAVLLLALRRGSARLGAAAALGAMLALVPVVGAGVDLVAAGRGVAGLAAEVRQRLGPGDLLVHEGPIERSGALEFYSGHRPVLVDATRSVLGFGATYPEARERFWDARRLGEAWVGPRRILLVTPRAPGRSLVGALPPDRVRLLLARNGRWLYESRPARPAGAGGGGLRRPPPLG